MSSITTIEVPRGMSPAAADKFISKERTIARMKEQAAEAERKMVSSVEAFGAGLGLGFIEARYDMEDVLGLPLPGVVGAVAHLAGIFAVGTPYAEHLDNLGNAGLAVYGADLGRDFGTKKKQEQSNQQAGFQPLGGGGVRT